MKPHLLFLALLTTGASVAQQPSPGFGRKLKTSTHTSGLAQQLNATVVPLPKDRSAGQMLLTKGASSPSLEPIRLRVVRDTATNLPVFIERKKVDDTRGLMLQRRAELGCRQQRLRRSRFSLWARFATCSSSINLRKILPFREPKRTN